eukprot:1002977-Rhodomonas_salina.1
MVAAQNAVEDGLDSLDFSAEAKLEQDGSERFVLALMALEDHLRHCSVGDLSEEDEDEEEEQEGEVRICRLVAPSSFLSKDAGCSLLFSFPPWMLDDNVRG